MAKVRVGHGLFKKESGEEEDKVLKCFMALDFANRVICVLDLAKRGREIAEVKFESVKEVNAEYNDNDKNKFKNAITIHFSCRATDTLKQFTISACSASEKERILK